MAAIRFPRVRAVVLFVALGYLPAALAVAAPRLVDAPVIWYEDDRQDIPMPEIRDPSLNKDMFESSVYDPVDNTLYPPRLIRNVGVLFGGDHVPAAANINALDEVPNSSWFTNRMGLFPLDPEQVTRGPGHGLGPDRSEPWLVVGAKTEGVTPGFTIRDTRGDLYLIKFDPPQYPGMTTAAGVIAGRIMYAAGYNVPDDAVVHFARSDLELGTDVEISLPTGDKRAMTTADLDTILAGVWRRDDGHYRALASRFLPGRPAGPFNYKGKRKDDPNDRIRHQDRRELRGLRTFSAWLFSFDTKQHNTLDMYVEEGGCRFLRHYLIDFASTLGSGAEGPVARINHEYTLSLTGLARRHLTVGLTEDDWRKIDPPAGLDEIGYYSTEYFDPRKYRPLQPNPAFSNRTDRDGYWAAKIISAFTDEHLAAIVAQGQYRNPEAAQYVLRVLSTRRDIIAKVYFDRIPPLDYFTFDDGTVAFHDLGAERNIYPGTTVVYRTRQTRCDAERNNDGWTAWRIGPDTALEVTELAPDPKLPFLAVECQVNRGDGWSRTVTAYIAPRSGSVIAVDR